MREMVFRAVAINLILKCNPEVAGKEISLYDYAEQEQTCNPMNADILHIRKVKRSICIQVKQLGTSSS